MKAAAMQFAILLLLFAAVCVGNNAHSFLACLRLQTDPTKKPSTLRSEGSTSEKTISEVYTKLPKPKGKLFHSWMKMPIDHFNLFDNRTWHMRYMFNTEFYKRGHPIFIEVGGEWEITTDDLVGGQMYKLAKKHNGLLILTEHRYYGQSLPFGTNFTTDNFKYLQIEEALEDLAYFIDHIKQISSSFKRSKVILHGCSYPGMLVTWMRLRFPNLVDISYASSAPLGIRLDYPEFYEVVYDAYAKVSPVCAEIIKRGFSLTQQLIKSKIGLNALRDALREWDCGDIDAMNSTDIIWNMIDVVNVMYNPVQYEESSCLMLSHNKSSEFQRFCDFIVQKSLEISACENKENQSKIEERNSIAWNYQTCTEIGVSQTLDINNPRHPFAINASLEESVDKCNDMFNNTVTKEVLKIGIERVTRRYGGRRPVVTKVITVQGKNDPWKHLATLEDYNAEAPVLLIDGAHCTDVSEKEDDPEDLLKTRKKIRDTISTWIKELS